ncbi:hypothetical protein HAX54_027622 [Datura stramonium]|uniref:Uncharacterized protein n=1 Tax=Datura stramonium TaxID=4076 RepID=A0ABS8Y558_DATST|nr:hypothetical protein [Datura stramonium]
MLESQGLQGPIIGSTYYNPEPAFDGGDHHAQNDYNLNVNVAGVLAYSGITTKFDTNVRNEAINGLGAADANFQQYINEQNISDPNNIVAASDANERKTATLCFNLDDFDFLLKSDEFPSFDLLDEQSSKFDQVSSDDQVK